MRVLLLPVPPCGHGGAGAVADVLAAANLEAGRPVFSTTIVSLDGAPVPLPGDALLRVADGVDEAMARGGCDLLLLHAEAEPDDATTRRVVDALRRHASRCGALGGLHAAPWLLARAGLLDGHRATIHWEEHDRFARAFERVIACRTLHESDRGRLTAAGGAAVTDMALALVEREAGAAVADAVAERLCLERRRPGREPQRVPAAARLGARQPKLTEALQLMEANLEEPLSTDEIARLAGLSRRQLERLFRQHLGTLPAKHYLALRLERARGLLRRTGLSVIQVGLSCGFVSGPHFSTAYRTHFGLAPREERARALPAPGDAKANGDVADAQ